MAADEKERALLQPQCLSFSSCWIAIIFCLQLTASRVLGEEEKVAHVRWEATNFPQMTAVYIKRGNSKFEIDLPRYNYTNITLLHHNGPESYWTVIATHFGSNVTIENDYLFLDSSYHPGYYTLCFYGNYTAANESLNLFIQVFNQSTPPTPKLGIDEAVLEVINNLTYPVNISQTSNNCYKCKPFSLGEVFPGENWMVVMDTTFGWTIEVQYATTGNISVCSKRKYFTEHSNYSLSIGVVDDDISCSLEKQNDVSFYTTYLPILYAVVSLLGVALLLVGGKIFSLFLRDRGCFHNLHLTRVDRVTARDLGNPRKVKADYGTVAPQETEPLNNNYDSSVNNGTLPVPGDGKTEPTQEKSQKKKKKRLASLDAFRGCSLMIMIFVNYGGGGYWFFDHSKWNGLTVADLVFPWFIWIMGVSIVFSYRGRRRDSVLSRLYQLLRRSVILFVLGIFLNNGFSLSHWRIPGVLQRFAITYFVVALTELVTSEIHHSIGMLTPKGRFLKAFRDITANVFQWLMIGILELLWLILTFLLPAEPGCHRGYLGPGGLSEDGKYYNCTGGAAGVIDRWIFTDNHLYQTPTAKETYHLIRPYDPEGALGSLNSIVLCFLGVQAGRILISYKKWYNIIIRFLLWGLLLGAIGVVLCEGQKNEGLIPLNKNLWSISFILVMAGTGFILLAVFYFMIDVISWWNGSPFKYPGMNSILVYVGSEVLQNYFPFSWEQQEDSHLELLFANIIGVSLWIGIAYYWYSIQFFVKI